jgi:hypothetical protein
MKEFKSNYEQVSEILERKNVKEIKGMFHSEKYNTFEYSDNADIIAELVIENSNDFTKDIASKMKEAADSDSNAYFSAKQAWCIAYQVINNINVYKEALKEMMK